jgi:hypothetical protein
MMWALLAAFLTRRPAWMQAVVFGTCVGLFVTAEANARGPLLSWTLVLTVAVAVLTGGVFYRTLRARAGRPPGSGGGPTWAHIAYPAACLLVIGAAVGALVGDGGLRVAALAIVPIVLLAPPAVSGIRALLRGQVPAAVFDRPAAAQGETPAGRGR